MFSRLLKTVLAILLVGIFGYVFYANFGNVWADLYERFFPCQREIIYNIGSVNPKFNLSEKDFLDAIKQAEMIWEKPMGREFFTFQSSDSLGGISENNLVINLVYDYRQDATVRIQALGLVVNDTRASYNSLREKYVALENEYLKIKDMYQLKVASFQNKQKEHIKNIDYWNKRGGAPQDVYKELTAEEVSLKKELSAIRDIESDINTRVNDINALVTVINNLARTLNINVRELNTIGESRGEEFTGGEFKSGGLGREINIYEFSTKDKLI